MNHDRTTMTQDWKSALAALRGEVSQEPEENPVVDSDADAVSAAAAAGGGAASSSRRRLRMFYEKKGRAGKPATIIEGFDPDDDSEALEVARRLKQRLGCGGSARGGEILLQGDRREKAAALLREWKYTV